MFETGKSPTEVGFLSPDIAGIIAEHRERHAVWFALAEDLNRTGQGTLAGVQIGPKEIPAQRLFGILLLIRTLSNFQGGLLMAERSMVVEARTLFRCCFENAFWIAALLKDGDRFIAEIMDDERASTRSKATWILKESARLDFSGPNAAARLRAYVEAMDKQWGKVSPQKMEEAARKGGIGDGYLYYKVLSGDAAHPSISALDRYVVRGQGETITGIKFGPDPDGIADSLNCGCQAMLAVGIAITGMLGDAKHNKEFAGHARVHAQLNGIQIEAGA
jgi:hypothetical protein